MDVDNPFTEFGPREYFSALVRSVVPTPEHRQAILSLVQAYRLQLFALGMVLTTEANRDTLEQRAQELLLDAVREMVLLPDNV